MNIFSRNKKVFAFGFVIFLGYLFLPLSVKANTSISEDISEDTIWTLSGSPYVVENSITILPTVTLTIEPGTVIKFLDSTNINIEGSLFIEKGSDDIVVFTSYYDDEYGGDTDFIDEFDDDIVPLPGDWDGLYFSYGSTSNINTNLLFRYASIAIIASSENLRFSNIDIEYSFDGIEVYKGEAILDNITFIGVQDYSLIAHHNARLIANNLTTSGSEFPISIYDNTDVNIDNIYVINSKNTAISIFSKSKLQSKNIKIQNSTGDGLEIFDKSSLITDSLEILDTKGNEAVILFGNSLLSADSINIVGGDYGIIFFRGATLYLSNGVISDFLYSGLADYGNNENYETNQIIFNSVQIKNNNISLGIYFDGSFYECDKCLIYDNEDFGIQSYSSANIDFTNVWWGSVTGPYNESLNPDGEGDKITGNILFDPFLKAKPSGNIPLIIIPGITGSYLYKDYDDYSEIWPNINRLVLNINKDSFLNDLALNIDATENPNFHMKVGDIIRNAKFETNLIKDESHVFDYFIDYLISNGYEENSDLFVFPYDWRFSNVSTAEILNQKIDEVLEETGANYVDIASHSMGGLVAKTYIRDYGSDKINNLIFIGTPHLGAPKGAKTLVYGDDMGINYVGIPLFNEKRAKFISQNMPAVYELIPSREYISQAGGYLHTTEEGNLDYTQSTNFLFEKGLNQFLYASADLLHREIDNIDFGNINIINIASCGSATLGQITVRPEKSLGFFTLKKDYDLSFTTGDTTVPFASSNALVIGEKYFINKVSHGSLPSAGGVPELVYKILKGGDTSEFDQDQSNCTPIEGDVLSKHSPIDLHIYDEYGNHAGPDESGNIENDISGVVYEVIEDKAFVFLPKGQKYHILGKATADGEFDLAIENVYGDSVNYTRYWKEISINNKSQVQLTINSGDYSSLALDIDGDNDFESTISDPISLGSNESYLDYSYIKFIEDHTEDQNNEQTSANQSSGILLQKNISLDTTDSIVDFSETAYQPVKNIKIDTQNNISSVIYTENQIKKIEEENEDILLLEKEQNLLVADVSSTKIPARTPLILFSFSILCLISAIFKKYYFTVE